MQSLDKYMKIARTVSASVPACQNDTALLETKVKVLFLDGSTGNLTSYHMKKTQYLCVNLGLEIKHARISSANIFAFNLLTPPFCREVWNP